MSGPVRSRWPGSRSLLVAVAVVSATPGAGGAFAATSVALSVGAGTCFGFVIVCFSRVGDDAGLWPVALSKGPAGVGLAALALAFSRSRPTLRGPLLPAGVAIGALELGGNVALILALQRGPVAIASVLISLYPVTAVMLATVILGERLSQHAAGLGRPVDHREAPRRGRGEDGGVRRARAACSPSAHGSVG